MAKVDNKFVKIQGADISSVTIEDAALFGASLDFADEGISTVEFLFAIGEASDTDTL